MIQSQNAVGRDPVTEVVIGAAYAVLNTLGAGFLEKVYENALAFELRQKPDILVEQQLPLHVFYKGMDVGDFTADLLVNKRVLVELKAVKHFEDAHMAQCLNYLKATGLRTCLLLNFGQSTLGIKRISL